MEAVLCGDDVDCLKAAVYAYIYRADCDESVFVELLCRWAIGRIDRLPIDALSLMAAVSAGLSLDVYELVCSRILQKLKTVSVK